MPHPRCIRTATVLLLAGLLLPAAAFAQAEATSAAPTPAEATPVAPATTTPAAPAHGGTQPAPVATPTPAQQAVLERIRWLRDGEPRRFGSCRYRWDRWRLQPDGSRTTSYSCEGGKIVDRTIGVHCGRLQINSYEPVAAANGKGETWAWGSWRLPQAGGEEQMVATLCANALPIPAAAPAAGTSADKPNSEPAAASKR
jgi:hypothetical protein